jgi:hypothetical protein
MPLNEREKWLARINSALEQFRRDDPLFRARYSRATNGKARDRASSAGVPSDRKRPEA